MSAAGAFAVACGDDDNDTDRGLNSSAPGVEEIVVDVTRDVGHNLAIHFRSAAGKPPVGARPPRFDFNEISRQVRDGEGVVTGDFLFAALGESRRKGSISIYYTPGGKGWQRTGVFDVAADVDVASHVFEMTVRDAATGMPIVGALAEARRVDEVRLTSTTFTDLLGRMRLEVLPGAFDIEVRRDDFEPVILRNVSTLDDELQLGEIRLVRLAKAAIL